jgi:hypothetical protein
MFTTKPGDQNSQFLVHFLSIDENLDNYIMAHVSTVASAGY